MSFAFQISSGGQKINVADPLIAEDVYRSLSLDVRKNLAYPDIFSYITRDANRALQAAVSEVDGFHLDQEAAAEALARLNALRSLQLERIY